MLFNFIPPKNAIIICLSEFPDIAHRISLGHIASYLGMTQETLSRIRRNDF